MYDSTCNFSVSIYCPFCHRHTALRTGVNRITDEYGHHREIPAIANVSNFIWWIGICNSCEGAVLVRNQGDIIFPGTQPSPSDPRIPDSLRRAMDESKKCASVSCYHAAVVMARRSIEIACVEKGCNPKSNLVQQISCLKSKGLITEMIEQWAAAVRLIGNEGAHNSNEPISKEDAEDCLHLAEQLIHVLYVTPSIAGKQLASRKKAEV